ncbi:uncharacterized protein LOC110500086 [Oncorhynchus mykiss]|uniref:uncharacterized protein LOC110500086 n=1 Tax=Oncorhynchus mykiss TaxID=8022 RepID=UPI001877A504|nr:uncharacterized protein LOC110500086 [Oncorhynchus mykiss]
MKDTHTLLNLLLLLVYLAGSAVTTDGGKDSTGGPLELTILGPDFVTVGVPCSFDCTAQCSPSCSYRMSIDGQIGQGNELFFTARQWEESLNLTCTARNDDSGRSSTVSKILQVLAGPTNVSITGPALMTPGAPQSFQCNADCRQSCNYTWGINGRWLGGQGNEITVTPEELATSVTLNCKAINSVSGLYDMATRTIPVTCGPLELTIVGPDFVTVGVPCSFDCTAQCSPSCSYRMSIDGQIGQGNELFFTARQWEESLNLTCTARNDDSGRSSTVSKILQVLAGPTNVSITGPDLMTQGAPQSFQCYADCRQSCNYTWGINGRWLGGQGNEITVTPEELATSVTLNCKAINSVSGLYDMATRTIPVTYGPLELTIVGPDFVTVGVPCSFDCTAQCSPSCSYRMSIDGQIGQGNELFFTARQWEESLNLTCTARNDDSGRSSTVSKILQVLDDGKSMATQAEQTIDLLLFTFTLSLYTVIST